ncbi:MAG: hypothetical protein L0170_11200 [Acidobacteria bacterium]|nr:hypothetical protein [Acidobacteriota bacterium]
MTSHRFFRIVWRINAIVLLVAAAVAILILGIGAVALGRDMFRTWGEREAVTVAGQRVESSRFQFENFELLPGTGVLRSPLAVYESYGFGSSGGGRAILNYFYYDSSTRNAHWLLKDNERLIWWSCDLKTSATQPAESRTLGSLYAVVESDSDHDGQLTSSDLSSVLLTDPAGAQETRILERVSDIQGCEVLSPSSAVLFYVSKSELRAATLDLGQLRIESDASLAAVPGRAPSR